MSNNFPLLRRKRLRRGLTGLDDRTANINNRLGFINTVLGGETAGFSTDYLDTLEAFRTRLEARKVKIATKKSRFTNFLNSVETEVGADSESFTSNQQTTVDSINTTFGNTYDYLLENLKYYPDTEKAIFFSLYDEATDNNLREIVIRAFFNL